MANLIEVLVVFLFSNLKELLVPDKLTLYVVVGLWERGWRLVYRKLYNKSPTHQPSCELSKMQTCVHMSNHVSQFTCLAYSVTCVHPLQSGCVFVYFTVQYCIEYSSTVSLFLACSLDASPCMPAVVLYYCNFQGTVL